MRFPGTGRISDLGHDAARGTTANVPLATHTGDASWLDCIRKVLPPLARRFRPDLIVSQHGCDPHRADPLAELQVTNDAMHEAARITKELAQELWRRPLGGDRRRRLPAGAGHPSGVGRRLGDHGGARAAGADRCGLGRRMAAALPCAPARDHDGRAPLRPARSARRPRRTRRRSAGCWSCWDCRATGSSSGSQPLTGAPNPRRSGSVGGPLQPGYSFSCPSRVYFSRKQKDA